MNTDYTEKESSRKKYLVPLVVIMLCLVAFTGAAYAYSTSVKGNGDIVGNYVALDMYKSSTDEQTKTTYTATADLDIKSGSFTVTTERNNTVNESDSYTAKIVGTRLIYSTILHVNTNLTSTTVYLKTPTYEFKAPGTSSKTSTEMGLGTLVVETVKDSEGNTINPTDAGNYTLDSTKYYTIFFYIPLEDGTTFGKYSNLTDLGTDIAQFGTSTSEIQVTFTASSTDTAN